MTRFHRYTGRACVFIATLTATSLVAEDDWRATYSLFGNQGIIDMPSAVAPPDGEIATTVSVFGGNERATFTFQLLPRLTGSFRYSQIDTYDRSFDIQYQISDEGQYLPALAFGLRDFIGTGRFSAEYLVATKTFGPNVRVSGGLGWGRLGSLDGFTNPLGVLDDRFEVRPDDSIDTGGTVLAGQFFRGDAAFFGGVEWRLNEDWAVLAEYSSDIYQRETDLIGFERKSPLNFGVTWNPSEMVQLGAYYMYGTEVGVSATLALDPKTRTAEGGLDSAPLPVLERAAGVAAAASWGVNGAPASGVPVLGQVMQSDGFRLLGAEVSGNTMRVRYENTVYRSEAQGVGRVARILSQLAPDTVDRFILEPTQRGIALSAVTVQRETLIALENEPDAAARVLARTRFADAAGPAPVIAYDAGAPSFLWGVSPYATVTLFDGNNPFRGDVGLEASFEYEVRPNIMISGSYRQSVLDRSDDDPSISASTLPPVRREVALFGADTGGGIEDLYIAAYGRPGRDLYSRVSLGYLERQFGGISTELLWKPVNSRFAVGAELNYAIRRDFDLGFGFQDYDVITGHVSGYYAFDNGFQAQVDVGQYLAGDIGATFGLDRVFDNGWKVGAFFTLTDVPFEDFGEGSFDKGIRIEIPVDSLIGTPTRRTTATTLRSLERDGGARLRVNGRLYDVIDGGHQDQMTQTWGRFWR